MSSSEGVFAITVNDGTATIVNTEPFSLDRVFQNRGTFTFAGGMWAVGNTYAPNPADGRTLNGYQGIARDLILPSREDPMGIP